MTPFPFWGPIPYVVILEIFYRESILVFPTQKLLGAGAPLTRLFNNSVNNKKFSISLRLWHDQDALENWECRSLCLSKAS